MAALEYLIVMSVDFHLRSTSPTDARVHSISSSSGPRWPQLHLQAPRATARVSALKSHYDVTMTDVGRI